MLRALLIVLASWAAIYLPALGSMEIRGEEGRRILAATAMLESGNYLVPYVGGDAYLRKPPLINWVIAGSFKLFGVRNEWTARLPSVLSLLAVAIAFLTIARRSLGPPGSLIAALIWLTNLGMLGKGRLIEIEALYVSLCALAMISWLSLWKQNHSPWLTWTVPWIFLGLGWLAKGPTHLFFFYAMVVAILWQTKQWRKLFHPAHLLGIIIMLSIFAAWALPFLQANEAQTVLNKWSVQFTGRVTGHFFRFWPWALDIPRTIAYLLPWLLVVPFIRFAKLENAEDRQLARALAWGITVPVIVIGLIPGGAPRYSLPMLTPFCWWLGMTFAHVAFAKPEWLGIENRSLRRSVVPIFVIIVVIFGLIGFPIVAVVMSHRPKVKNIADKFNAAVPAGETLYAVAPNYQPFFFYVHAPVKYVHSVGKVPDSARFFVTRPGDREEALASKQWEPRHARSIFQVTDYRHQTLILLTLDPP